MDKPIVFLSHSSKDSPTLNRLKAGLEEKTHGTIAFFLSSDGESIPFGRNWVSSIEEALKTAKLAFVFLSPHSVLSGWVHFESGFMFSKGIDVVPIGLPGVDVAKVPPPLSILQGFNVRSHDSLNNLFSKINKTFETKHVDLFCEEDYQRIFEQSTNKQPRYFGIYSDKMGEIVFVANPPVMLVPELKKCIEAKGLEAGIREVTNSPTNTQTLTTYGLTIMEDKGGGFHGRLSPEMVGVMFDVLDQAFSAVNLTTAIHFTITVLNVRIPVESKLTGKLYGSQIKILHNGELDFKGIHFTLDGRSFPTAIIGLDYSGKLGDLRLNELVSLLFHLGVFYEGENATFDVGQF